MYRCWLALLACLLAAPTAAIAEPEIPSEETDRDADERTLLDAVVVSGTRTRQRAFDVAESISRLDADQIRQMGVNQLGEALAGMAGVDLAGGPRASGQQLNIRGLSGTRVLLSVDGARQNFDGGHRSRLLVDPDLLESVEVLRGPASAIWGSDALGGVVSLTTRDAADLLRPGDNWGAKLSAQTGSAANELGSGATVFSQTDGTGLIASLNRSSYDDLVQGGGTVLPWSAGQTDGALFKADQMIGDAELEFSHQRFELAETSPSNPANPLSDTNPLLDKRDRQSYTTGRYSFARDPNGGGIVGTSLIFYRSALDVIEDRVDEPRHDTLNFRTTGGSVQTSYSLPGWGLLLTVGGERFVDHASATRNGAARPQFPDANREVAGIFAQTEWQLGKWRITPGLRLDRFTGQSDTDAAEDVKESAVNGKLGLGWSPIEALNLSLSYSGGFRAPSMLESFAEGQHFLGNDFTPNPNLRPEKADKFEAGIRWRLPNPTLFGAALGDRIEARMSVYDMRIRDYIETTVEVVSEGPFPPPTQCLPPSPAVGCVNRNDDGSANPMVPPVFVGGTTTSTNLDRARIRGTDLEAGWLLGPAKLALAYNQLRGENEETGMPLLNIPANTLKATLSGQLGPLELGLRHTRGAAQDRVPLDSEGNPIIPTTEAYAVTDFFGTWRPALASLDLRLDFGIDNLADSRWRRHLSQFAEAGRNLRVGASLLF